MAASTTPIFPNVVRSAVAQFTNADTTTAKAIYTPTGTNGARVDGITVTNTDTNPYTVQLFMRQGSTNYLLGTASIPASAGNLGTVQPVNLLAAIAVASGGPNPFPVDAQGNMILYLDASTSLWAAMTGTITAAKSVNFTTLGGEY